jgi:hypothetical protein
MSSEAEGGIDCLRIERRRGGAQDGMPRRLGKPWPDVMLRLLETFSGAPLVSHYFARYGNVYSTPPSEQVRGLFERWSIKFFGRLLRRKGPAGRWKRPAFGLAGQTSFEAHALTRRGANGPPGLPPPEIAALRRHSYRREYEQEHHHQAEQGPRDIGSP